MTADEFVAEFAEIVEVEPGEISMSTALDEVQTWDSLSQVSFLALLDERFEKSVTSEELEKAKTVSDLWALASA